MLTSSGYAPFPKVFDYFQHTDPGSRCFLVLASDAPIHLGHSEEAQSRRDTKCSRSPSWNDFRYHSDLILSSGRLL